MAGPNYIDQLGSAAGQARGQIRNLASELAGVGRSVAGLSRQMAQARQAGGKGRRELSNANDAYINRSSDISGPALQKLVERMDAAKERVRDLDRSLKQAAWDTFFKGADKAGASVLRLNAGIAGLGLDALVSGIKRVYELQEKWTRAMGAFNVKLGAAGAGMASTTKAALRWEGTMRGLTDQFGQGLEMFGDFTLGFGRLVKSGEGWVDLGLQLARGFDLGGKQAGDFLRTLDNMGLSADDTAKLMGKVVDAADASGVSVNQLAKDVAEADSYMARFGKSGAKSFVAAAGYARKFGISVKELQQIAQKFDAFDQATEVAAKLNVVFGTAINSMDLMLEDDPAKRLEMIRRELLARGKTFDALSPKERRYLSETIGLDEKKTAALLAARDAGETYGDYLAKEEKKERTAVEAKELMQRQLQKTAQTMYAFGAAFDQITVAIANAIKPILEVFGLAQKGGEKFKSFGEVMKAITDKIVGFFNALGKNTAWTNFMKEIADDIVKLGRGIGDLMSPENVTKAVRSIVPFLKDMYKFGKDAFGTMVDVGKQLIPVLGFVLKYSKEILIGWLALKGVNLAQSVAGGIGSLGKGVGAVAGNRFGRAGLGAALGAGVGGVIGGAGAAAGGAVGGALGGLMGPIGTIVGPIIGAVVGRLIEKLSETPAEKRLRAALEERAEVEGKVAEATKRRDYMESLILEQQQKNEAIRNAKEGPLLEQQLLTLSEFSIRGREAGIMFADLQDKGKLTPEQFKLLAKISAEYYGEVDKLTTLSRQQYDADLSKLKLQMNQQGLEIETKKAEYEHQSALNEMAAKEKQVASFLESHGGLAGLVGEQAKGNSAPSKMFFGMVEDLKNAKEKEKDAARSIQEVSTKRLKSELGFLEAEQKLMARKLLLEKFKDEFTAYSRNFPGTSIAQVQKFFFDKLVSEGVGGAQEARQSFDQILPKYAEGGIVSRPTIAMVGEAGPEAIVPLRGSLKAQLPSRSMFRGGQSAANQAPVFQLVAGDVYLDGEKVGRSLARAILTSRGA